jgi:hypothetical protein
MTALRMPRALRSFRALRVPRVLRALRPVLLPLAFAAAQPASAGPLEQAIAAAPSGTWVEYDVALVPGDATPCCFDWRGGKVEARACPLESRSWNYGTRDDMVRSSDRLRVFLRKDGGGIDRVKAVGGDCPVEAGGATVRAIEGVADAESVAVLARLASAGEQKRGETLGAIAMHADRSAGAALAKLAQDGSSDSRGDALFWLAQRGDAEAERVIRAALAPENPVSVQKKAIFALSQLPDDRAVPALTEIVESDRPRAVRKEALFWLAQEGSDEAFAVFDRIFAH